MCKLRVMICSCNGNRFSPAKLILEDHLEAEEQKAEGQKAEEQKAEGQNAAGLQRAAAALAL